MKQALVALVALGLASTGWAQVTQRVSISTSGAQGSADGLPWLSLDGRYVVFQSCADILVAGDTNGHCDALVRDRQAGTTELASVSSTGGQGDGDSLMPRISGDGRFVAFMSQATNLVPGDNNGRDDVFVHDRQTGMTFLVSVDSAGTLGNGESYRPGISADGRYVGFVSESTNLVPGDTNGQADIFVHDMQTGTTEMASVDSNGVQQNYGNLADAPSISADGRFVAFSSPATNLDPRATNFQSHVYVRDRQAGLTELVSVDSGGTAYSFADQPSLSGDGRFVAFRCVFGVDIVRVHDRQTGVTVLVSVSTNGTAADRDCNFAQISADGGHVVFASTATNLVSGDTAGWQDIFVRDLGTGVTERASVTSSGVQANGHSYWPALANDGRYVAFMSRANNLAYGDLSDSFDQFVRDRLGAPSFTSLCDPGVGGVVACPCSNPPGGSDRGCNNSSGTGGAALAASGGTIVSSDSLMFTTAGEKPTATSIVLQGTTSLASGAVYGQGVRCVGGALKRLFTKQANAGSITAPNFTAGDPTVSARSAAKGDVIQPGSSRWYLVYYRDPTILGGCPASATFNATQTGQVTWSP